MAVTVTAGQRHESTQFEAVMGQVRVPRPKGRPRRRPRKLAGDKGYSYRRIRRYLRRRGIKAVIPTRKDQKRLPGFDKATYRRRNVVERCIGWLKDRRRLATRFEKLAENFLAMVKLADRWGWVRYPEAGRGYSTRRGGPPMSLLDQPEAQALLNDADPHARGRRRLCRPPHRLPPTLPAPLLSQRAAPQRDPRHPRPAQRPGAQDLRADRHPGRAAPQADPVLRRRRQVGRRGRHGRTAARTSARNWPTPDGVVVIDPSAFPKKGTESCGVGRQWCGRLGKVDNCQVGVFLAYAAAAGYAPLDRRLYLPEDWADDTARREKCHVPPEVKFQEKWRIALDLLDRSLPGLPHGWIAGDDEFGRASEFRAQLRLRAGALRPGRAVQHHGARPGAAATAAQAGRGRPQARGAVPAGRRLGDEPAGVAVGRG